MFKYIILLFIALATFACGSKDNKDASSTSNSTPKPVVDGAAVFKKNCELCHGADGKLGLNGSKDLTISEFDLNERITMITKGKDVMMAFENILSLSEIKAVAEYSMTLKK